MSRLISEIEAELAAVKKAKKEKQAAAWKAAGATAWNAEREAWQRIHALRAELAAAKEAQR